MLWSANELNELFDCNLPDNFEINGVSIDSRRAHQKDLFIALKGDTQDGHSYVHAAAEKGCTAAIVDRLIADVPNSCRQIIVKDTMIALETLARYARKRSKAKIIAVTGSVGKTSTKDMLRQLLQQFGKTSCAVESYNNGWGVPLSLARMQADSDFGVFEVGMNHPGEIAPLAEMIQPHIAIITAIAPAHIGNMGTEMAIATEKAEIFKGLCENGVAIIPKDTIYTTLLQEAATKQNALKIMTIGEAPGADYQLLDYEPTKNAHHGLVTVKLPNDKKMEYAFSVPGRHQSLNTLICLATTTSLNLPETEVTSLFPSITPVQGRGVFHKLTLTGNRTITLIDDAYNANVTSMSASISMLANVEPCTNGRRIVVVGEMLELDHEANSHHTQIAELINKLPIDVAYFVGGQPASHGYNIVHIDKQGLFTPRAEDLKPVLMNLIQDGDVILIKGSKGTRVSLLVNHLLAHSLSDQRG